MLLVTQRCDYVAREVIVLLESCDCIARELSLCC